MPYLSYRILCKRLALKTPPHHRHPPSSTEVHRQRGWLWTPVGTPPLCAVDVICNYKICNLSSSIEVDRPSARVTVEARRHSTAPVGFYASRVAWSPHHSDLSCGLNYKDRFECCLSCNSLKLLCKRTSTADGGWQWCGGVFRVTTI